ncbi:putative uncharacterized protein DDB_G0271606 [Episyrphus balteatus]|uniref:putative uncharacterized protein DDB_G0271606 n=1 Tax=Episyrphus balteatus TaxID=286459 RepID=UPI002486C6D1|nr:putative uncharacterized protein DDB_G0271606 [Episyrphus balteatus]
MGGVKKRRRRIFAPNLPPNASKRRSKDPSAELPAEGEETARTSTASLAAIREQQQNALPTDEEFGYESEGANGAPESTSSTHCSDAEGKAGDAPSDKEAANAAKTAEQQQQLAKKLELQNQQQQKQQPKQQTKQQRQRQQQLPAQDAQQQQQLPVQVPGQQIQKSPAQQQQQQQAPDATKPSGSKRQERTDQQQAQEQQQQIGHQQQPQTNNPKKENVPPINVYKMELEDTINGIDSCTEPQMLYDELCRKASGDIEIISVKPFQMALSRREKRKLPIFLVQLSPNSKLDSLRNITILNYQVVTWNKLKRRGDMLQCVRC